VDLAEFGSVQSLPRHGLDAAALSKLRIQEVDYGGCRCQAFALTGNAANTDPACALSPLHEQIFKTATIESAGDTRLFIYRNFAGGTLETDVHGT
jgi:pyrroloquinoline quinone biosynthesis protein E